MEGARGDEQDVIGFHIAALGRDDRALDQRQQITLHPLATDIGADALGARGDLVHLVEEDDAVVLDHVDRLADDAVLVEQLVGLFADQRLVGVGNGHPLFLGRTAAERLAQHFANIEHAHLRARHAGNVEGRQLQRRRVGHLNLDLPVVQLAASQHAAKLLARLGTGLVPHQGGDHPLLGRELGLGGDLLAQPLAGHVHGDLQQVADDLLDIPADVADLRELGRLHLEERRLRQVGEPAGDLGLADARRADHQDVLRQNLLAHVAVELLAPPAIAQRDGDGALGIVLADDVPVQLGDDLTGREAAHRVSITTFVLVKTQMPAAIAIARPAISAASRSSRSIIARAAARA